MTRLSFTGGRFRSLLVLLLAVSLALGLAACTPQKPQAVTPPPAQTQPSSQPAPPSAAAQSPPSPTVKGDLVVRFLDVGQGDAIYISLPDGTSMLIDAGPKNAGSDVVSTIRDLGVKKIDYVVLTHPHEDHIGGADAVLKAFDVGQVVMPRTSHTMQTYEDLLTAIAGKGLTITEAKARKVVIDKGNLRAWLIGPSKSYEDLNDWSAVLSLKYGDRTFLFEGDASNKAEGDMLAAKVVPDADVLKVGHHGSSTSTGQSFLQAVTPAVAIISVGASTRPSPRSTGSRQQEQRSTAPTRAEPSSPPRIAALSTWHRSARAQARRQ